MATIAPSNPSPRVESRTPTLADILENIGVPASRVLAWPFPGTATVEDLIAVNDHEDRICELVDGMLVEKVLGFDRSLFTSQLIYLLMNFLDRQRLGVVAGPSGTMLLAPGLVRAPDVSFVSRDRFPPGRIRLGSVPALSPTLAVDVWGERNRKAEMDRKLREYFAAGSKLVWYLDPADRSVRVYTSPDRFTRLDESGTLDGGDVLPGFRLAIRDWFEMAENPFGDA